MTAYEAQMADLQRIYRERAQHLDTAGMKWAQEAMESLRRERDKKITAGAMIDAMNAFKKAQPFGWR